MLIHLISLLKWPKGVTFVCIYFLYTVMTQQEEIKNNAWDTMNNSHEWGDLLMIFMSDEVRHKWKSQANRLMNDPKIGIHGNECVILFLTCYFMSWTHNSTKNDYRSLISPLSQRTDFSDLVLWCHHSWSVTSHGCGVLALWRHIRWLLLHVQVGAKKIFTSE